MHTRLPQQPVLMVQTPPSGRQQKVGPPVVKDAQVLADAQQFGEVPVVVHDAPSPMLQVVGGWQVPPWQSRLPQQPVLIVQAPPWLRQQ